MSHENGIDVITIVELDGIPLGSVLQECIEVIDSEGTPCWSGLWCSMWGSYHALVAQDDCEIWDEEKHDILYPIKKRLEKQKAEREEAEERATLALLKAKYEKE